VSCDLEPFIKNEKGIWSLLLKMKKGSGAFYYKRIMDLEPFIKKSIKIKPPGSSQSRWAPFAYRFPVIPFDFP